jgi:hypothetical protein
MRRDFGPLKLQLQVNMHGLVWMTSRTFQSPRHASISGVAWRLAVEVQTSAVPFVTRAFGTTDAFHTINLTRLPLASLNASDDTHDSVNVDMVTA